MLRSWICKPLSQIAAINERWVPNAPFRLPCLHSFVSRLDAVEGIMGQPSFETTFAKLAKGLPDLERIVARIHSKSCSVKDFLKLLRAYERLDAGLLELRASAEGINSVLLQRLLALPGSLAGPLDAVKSCFEEPGGPLYVSLLSLLKPVNIEGKALDLVPRAGKDAACDAIQSEIEDLENWLTTELSKLENNLRLVK